MTYREAARKLNNTEYLLDFDRPEPEGDDERQNDGRYRG